MQTLITATLRLGLAAGLCLTGVATAPAADRAPAADAQSAVIRAGFTPADQGPSAEDLVTGAIDAARHRIRVAMYEFTSWRIAAALVRAQRRGIDVRLVVDPAALRPPRHLAPDRSAVARVLAAGVPLRVDRQYAVMHHKFMVVDGRQLSLGSFNYTYSAATRNAEDVLRVDDAPALAARFEAEWNRLWSEAEPTTISSVSDAKKADKNGRAR